MLIATEVFSLYSLSVVPGAPGTMTAAPAAIAATARWPGVGPAWRAALSAVYVDGVAISGDSNFQDAVLGGDAAAAQWRHLAFVFGTAQSCTPTFFGAAPVSGVSSTGTSGNMEVEVAEVRVASSAASPAAVAAR
jgi:hypothetical protein